ncbi:Rrf2 family transcriptional regulator [Bacteriovorax sp. PP10]|uniref:Rrf2 family transcriptional regulator n=1 Tax=Bacteriovorax antarcticus TaxID=3088717 RepID=A0ABU5VZD0_9BACT|nr:Rrf2 family transcriptional regulator [Bacteriovorax sp. PP10]MEA9358436.1 Rrf2 family transcriptional regulator [Bacteriovorax sp. PP10]
MSSTNVQFSTGIHILVGLAAHYGNDVTSSSLASSVNAEPSFVRKVISKLVKAGLVESTRGKNGACSLAKSPKSITLLDIYQAIEAPQIFNIHTYPVQKSCTISCNIKGQLESTLGNVQKAMEKELSKITLDKITNEITQ